MQWRCSRETLSLGEELQLVTRVLSSRYGRTASSQALSWRASRHIPSRDKMLQMLQRTRENSIKGIHKGSELMHFYDCSCGAWPALPPLPGPRAEHPTSSSRALTAAHSHPPPAPPPRALSMSSARSQRRGACIRHVWSNVGPCITHLWTYQGTK